MDVYCPLDIRPVQNIPVPVTPKIRENPVRTNYISKKIFLANKLTRITVSKGCDKSEMTENIYLTVT